MASSFARWLSGRAWVALLLGAVAATGCSSSGLTCLAGQTACGNSCVDLQTDPLHCGGCTTSCFAGATCTAGFCGCPSATPDSCGQKCVNVQTDAANCGACGHSCGLGTCAAATCACNGAPATVKYCPAGSPTGTCVDTATSGSNCGDCGTVCVPANVCSASTCQCLAPNTLCNPGSASAVCTNTAADRVNCGTCGHACAAGQTCSSGTCVDTCPAGFTSCSGVCVDLNTSAANCGTCGQSCASGQVCSAGTCQATCSSRVCGGTCCGDQTACCGTSCPSRHRNFIGTPDVQTYFDCTPTGTYNVETARTAAAKWAPDGNEITPTQSCPTLGGGSLCVVWQRPLLGAAIGCGVWCYEGSFAGTLAVTSTYSCPCPTALGTDWD